MHDGCQKIKSGKYYAQNGMRKKKRHQKADGGKGYAYKETILYIYYAFLLFFEKNGVQKEKEKIGDQSAEGCAAKPEARGEHGAEHKLEECGGEGAQRDCAAPLGREGGADRNGRKKGERNGKAKGRNGKNARFVGCGSEERKKLRSGKDHEQGERAEQESDLLRRFGYATVLTRRCFAQDPGLECAAEARSDQRERKPDRVRDRIRTEGCTAKHPLHREARRLRHKGEGEIMRQKRELEREEKPPYLLVEEVRAAAKNGEKRDSSEQDRKRRAGKNARPLSDGEPKEQKYTEKRRAEIGGEIHCAKRAITVKVSAFGTKERKGNACRHLQGKHGEEQGRKLASQEKGGDRKERQADRKRKAKGRAEQTILLSLIALERAVDRRSAEAERRHGKKQSLVAEIERVAPEGLRAEVRGEEGKCDERGGLSDRRGENIEKGGRGGARQPCFACLHEKPLCVFPAASVRFATVFHIISRALLYYCRKKRWQMLFYAKNDRPCRDLMKKEFFSKTY